MLYNYLLIALRNLRKQTTFSIINILGLAVGMACCLLILQYVRYELSWDRQPPQAEQIYRVLREKEQPDGSSQFSWGLSGPLRMAIEAKIPEVELATRIWPHGVDMRHGETFLRTGFAFVDTNHFDLFPVRLLDGSDPRAALRSPASILVQEKTAKRFFGDEDPVGKTIRVSNAIAVGDYVVAGVIQDRERNNTGGYAAFMTMHYPNEVYPQTLWIDWLPGTWRMTQIYLRLSAGADPVRIEAQLQEIMREHLGPEVARTERYRLQQVVRTHLYSDRDFGMPWGRNVEHVYVLITVASLVILIACVNFINLSTARATRRAREVGVRKALGSLRSQLVGQFVLESMLVALLASAAACVLAQAALPAFNDLLTLELTLGTEILPWIAVLTAVVGLLAGIYPSLLLSGFQPVAALKGGTGATKTEHLRRGLVVFQFTISTLLAIGTMVVYEQLRYIGERDLGYDTEGVVEIPSLLQSRRDQVEAIKAQFLEHPNVLLSTSAPWQSLLEPRRVTLRHPERSKGISVNSVGTDADFVATLGLRVKQGRDMGFKEKRDLGRGPNEFLLNESAVRALGLDDPIGQEVLLSGVDEQRLYGKDFVAGRVVGIVEDFPYQSAHHPIQPLLIHQTYWSSGLYLRVGTENLSATIDFLQSTWNRVVPDLAFQYRFLDDELEAAYAEERQTAALAFVAAGMAIFVACLGLLGLAAYAAERRSKEIAIRKVLGASVASVLVLLSGEFLRLLAIANVLAWPLAYYVASNWLETFAYRIDLGPAVFVLGSALAAILALATVVAQTTKAATANPVDMLRSE